MPDECEPYEQPAIPTWHGPIRDPLTGHWITSHVMNQDFVAWLGQGTIADRSRESLGTSDRGIIMIRKRYLEDLAAVAAGADPKGTIRDAVRNENVVLPIALRTLFTEGYPRARLEGNAIGSVSPTFPFQYGQPAAVREEFERAMGIGDRYEPARRFERTS